jgi:hypothetical protein
MSETIDQPGLAERVLEFYDTRLRPELEADHAGEFVAFELECGEYALASDPDGAKRRLYQRLGTGVNSTVVEVGGSDAEKRAHPRVVEWPRLGPAESDELVRKAVEFYDRELKEQLEPQHFNEFIAIDVATGHYALGRRALEAFDALAALDTGGVPVLLRVGGPEAFRYVG